MGVAKFGHLSRFCKKPVEGPMRKLADLMLLKLDAMDRHLSIIFLHFILQ